MADADVTIHINRIKGDPNNVRTKVDVSKVKQLAESIKSVGLLQPLIVRPHEDGYQVIAGHRRLAAIGLLVDEGEHSGEVEVVLRDAGITEADITVQQLVENLQREDIDPIDEAHGFARLLTFDMSQADIARKIGRSRAHITKRLALLSLPEKVQAKVRTGEVQIELALAIAALDEEDQAEFVAAGRFDDEWGLTRLLRQAKGKKAAAKAAETLAGLGVEVVDNIEEVEAPEGFHYLTLEWVHTEDWDGASIPEGAVAATIEPSGEQARIRFFELAEHSQVAKADAKAAKQEAAEKERKREERALERAKTDFLVNALGKVKKADADDFAMRYILDRVVSYSTARDVCLLLDLEVPVKEETSYDGKTRNVKQYAPLVFSLIKEARDNGDIGFLRRVVMAGIAAHSYRDSMLEHFGFDPEAATTDDG